MNKIPYLTLAVVSFLLASFAGCDTIKEHFAGHAQHTHEHQAASGSKPELTLNAGKKWNADDFTVTSIHAMQSKLAPYSRKQPVMTAAEYISLQKTLQADVEDLIRGCKMTGRDHEELHKFLEIMNSEIRGLTSEKIENSRDSLKNIDALLAKFSEYFE